jgi:glycosyltransferase involved in cell wall biosynthesis
MSEIDAAKRLNPSSPNGFISDVAVLILTYNEASNIGRSLEALAGFPEIVVLDSGSADATCEIAASYPNVRMAVRPFDQHAMQWNYGLTSCGITRPWVLALDADFVVSERLVEEISALAPDLETAGYWISFCYCVLGRPLSATLYPPLVALFRRERAHYIQEGHTQRAAVDGRLLHLSGRINHDDRKPLSRWLASQQTYARLEAEHLLVKPAAKLRTSDRIRLMGWLAPIVVFAYTLIAKRCILDGWHGWFYVLQRSLAECMIALEIVDRRLRNQRRN